MLTHPTIDQLRALRLTTLSGVRFGFTIASTDAIARHQASSRLDDYETSIE